MAQTDMPKIITAFRDGLGRLARPRAPEWVRDSKFAVAGALAFAVALAVAHGPAPVFEEGLWYDADGRLMVQDEITTAALAKPRGVTVVPGSADKLYKDFRSIGYRLEDVMAGTEPVPRVFVKAIPGDIRQLSSVNTRKAVFIKTMLPLILRVNEELRQSRARILELTDRLQEGGVLTDTEDAWLQAQYERHGVAPGRLEILLRRVDVIPPSLALAQAAEESGWGTSRFALEGRALFGQRTYSDGPGLVPQAYAEEAGFKVRSFDELLEGVRSYARNLNTHNAYAEFRKLRAEMRRGARGTYGFSSMRLIEALHNYSERGQDYVDSIKSIIRVNNLARLDGARLSDAAVTGAFASRQAS